MCVKSLLLCLLPMGLDWGQFEHILEDNVSLPEEEGTYVFLGYWKLHLYFSNLFGHQMGPGCKLRLNTSPYYWSHLLDRKT